MFFLPTVIVFRTFVCQWYKYMTQIFWKLLPSFWHLFCFLLSFFFIEPMRGETEWDNDIVYNSYLKEQKTLGTMADWRCFWRAHRTTRGLSHSFSFTPLSPGSMLFPSSVSSAKLLWKKKQRCKLLKTWPQREKKGLRRQKPRMILFLLLFVLTLR